MPETKVDDRNCTAPFERAQHEEEADWFGGSSSYDCRSRFEQVCDVDGTHLSCNLIVGNSTQASAICRLTSNQKDPNWFCDYQVTFDLE